MEFKKSCKCSSSGSPAPSSPGVSPAGLASSGSVSSGIGSSAARRTRSASFSQAIASHLLVTTPGAVEADARLRAAVPSPFPSVLIRSRGAPTSAVRTAMGPVQRCNDKSARSRSRRCGRCAPRAGQARREPECLPPSQPQRGVRHRTRPPGCRTRPPGTSTSSALLLILVSVIVPAFGAVTGTSLVLAFGAASESAGTLQEVCAVLG